MSFFFFAVFIGSINCKEDIRFYITIFVWIYIFALVIKSTNGHYSLTVEESR